MRGPWILLASTVTIAAVIGSIAAAGGWTTSTGAGVDEKVVLPTGTVLRFPTAGVVDFTVPFEGAVLTGTAYVDHETALGAYPAGSLFECPARLPNATYSGPGWVYTVNDTLTPGNYFWGPPCGGWANVTITQQFAILYP